MSGPGDIPALEAGMGMMSLPIGMTRRALSYDDNLEAPMSPPPSDISINNLWRRPLIPERRFQQGEEDDSGGAQSYTATFAAAKPHVPVVKTKASSAIMNSLMTKQTQDSMYKFEQKVGLTDSSYTPHKGLTAEETRYHQRMPPDSFHKLQAQSTDVREDKSASSGQSTPSSTPQSSPKNTRRGWFSSQGSELSVSSGSSVDLGSGGSGGAGGSGEAGGGVVERWSAFGPRPGHTTSDLGTETGSNITKGFSLQAYRGAQKPSPMELMKAQATRLADDAATQKPAPPKMEVPGVEERRGSSRPHRLKHRDMNVLTPSGF